jgi:hypothetical protein
MRIRQLGLHGALTLLPYTTGLSAVVSVGLVAVKAWRQPAFAHAGIVVGLAAGAMLVALAIGLWLRHRTIDTPAWLNARGAASWALGLQLGVVLLTVPVFVLVTHVAADDLQWSWPFLNKRWLVALYSLGVGTLVLLPVAAEWWRSDAGLDAPASEAAREASRRTVHRSWPATLGGLVAIVALAWYFGGPPWHLDRHHRWIESHEEAHLGALQAVSKGYLPYVGPASTQYGPGSQLLIYEIMRHSAGFTIVSFRTAWAVFHFTTLLAIAVAAYLWLGLGPAGAVVVLAVTYSPLAFYGTAPDGTLSGFYGWGSGLRYLAPILIVPALVRAAAVGPDRRPLASVWVVLLGVLWGAASWVSQENLSSTAIAAALLLSLLCFTRTVPPSRAIRIARDLLAGFAIAAAPALIYYAMHGALGSFVENYFRVPQAVASGYSNTWWPADGTSPRTFYAAPVFFLAVTIATLWRLPSLTLNAPLDQSRAQLLAFLSVALVCYQVSLMRSDAGHLQNTMMAAPFVLVLGARSLPSWLAAGSRGRWIARGAFVLAALATFPSGKLLLWRQILVTPYTRFVGTGAAVAATEPDTPVAFARATPFLADEPEAISGSAMSMRTALDFADDVHAIVGRRPTYVDRMGEMWTGPLYFLADLTPAPYPLDSDTMMINNVMEARVVEHIRTHPSDYDCFIGDSLESPEARAFIEVHPGAERVDRMLGPTLIHILLAQPIRPL